MKNKLLSQLYESCKKWKTLVLLGAMLLIGMNSAWADNIPAGTTIYVDVTNFSGEYTYGYYLSVVHSDNKSKRLDKYDTSGASNSGGYVPNKDTWTYKTLTRVGSTNIYYTTISSAVSDAKLSLWSKDCSGYNDCWTIDVAGNIAYESGKNLIEIVSGYTKNDSRNTCCFSATWGTYNTTYSVSYNGNGNSGGSAPTDATEYDSGDAVTVAGNTGNMTKSGYVFAGWNTAANGSGVYYAPGETFTITTSTTLYAQWLDVNVLNGTKIMVYGGERTNWNKNQYFFMNTNSTSDIAATATKVIESTTFGGETCWFGPVVISSGTYFHGHPGWAPNFSCTIAAGNAYLIMNGSPNTTYFELKAGSSGYEALYRVKKAGDTSPTTTVSTDIDESVTQGGSISVSSSPTAGNAGVSVLDRPNHMQYFLKNGSDWSLISVSGGYADVSDLSVATGYKIATVLTDGCVYVRTDVDDFEVESAGGTVTLTAGTGGTVSKDNENWGASKTISGITSDQVVNIYARANDGYSFSTWTKTAGTGSVGTNAASGTYNAIAGSDEAVTASFTENMTRVNLTASPSGAGTFTSGGTVTYVDAGVTTHPSVTAAPNFGYRLNTSSTIWSESSDYISISPNNAATTTVTGSGALSKTATLTATFTPIYCFVEGRFQIYDASQTTPTTTYKSDQDWNENSANIRMEYDETNHRYYLHTHRTPAQLSEKLKNHNPYLYFKTSKVNNSVSSPDYLLDYYQSSSSQELDNDYGTSHKKTLVKNTGANNNLKFNSTITTGYAVLYFDGTDVWYDLEQRLQYNGNGGSGSAPSGHNTYYITGNTATAATNTYSKSGYDFGGWATSKANADAGTKAYDEGDDIPMSADVTLYAIWTPKEHNITRTDPTNGSYTIKVGDAAAVSTSTTAGYGKTITLSASNSTTGYHFTGWTVAKDAGGSITPSSSATANPATFSMPDEDVTVSASFALDVYSITYKDQGDVSFSGSHADGHPTTHTYGTATTLKTASKTGYTFGGWFKSSACTGDAVTSLGATEYTSAPTLYAKWTAKTYTVNFDQQDGTGGSSSVTATYDSDMPSATMPTRSGYIFDGYYASANGVGTKYYNANGSSATSWNVASGTTLYANWIQPQITYSNSNVSSDPASGTKFACGSTGNKMVITPNSGYKITAIEASDAAISASADGNATGSWTVTGTMPAEDVTLTITTAAVPEVRILGRFRIYNSTHTAYSSLNGTGNLSWTEGYNNSHISMTYDHATGLYYLPTYRTYAELKADNDGGAILYVWPETSSRKYGSIDGTDVATPTSMPGSANIHGVSGGGKFKFDGSANLANVVLHFDADNLKFWLTGDTPTDNSVTFNAGDHGSITANATNITSGNSSSVTISSSGNTLSATPSSGYTFDHWETTGNVYVSFPNNASTIVVSTGTGGTVTAVWGVNSGWYLSGDHFGGWGTDKRSSPFNRFYRGLSGVYYREVTLDSGDHWFKVHDTSSEKGPKVNGTVVDKNGAAVMFDGEQAFKCNLSGTVWFVINTNDNELFIQDPQVYKRLTYSIGTIVGTAGTISTDPSTASGSYVEKDSEITLTAPEAKEGYSWSGWFTDAAGTTGQITDVNRAIAVTMDDDVEVYACYTINNHSITHSAATNGTYTIQVGSEDAVSDDTNADYGTTITLAASPSAGYYCSSWTVTKDGGGTVTVSSNQFTMPDDDVTVEATFSARYALRGSKTNEAAGGMPGWSVTTSNMDVVASTSTKTLALEPNTDYKYKIYDNKPTAGTHGQQNATSQSLGTEWTLNGDNDVFFTTQGYGDYTFSVREGTYPAVTVSGPTSCQLTLGRKVYYNDNEGTLENATNTNGGTVIGHTNENTTGYDIDNAGYFASGSNITFTATPATGYRVVGWYNNADCAANHAYEDNSGSTGTVIISADKKTLTLKNLTSATTVYVKYAEKMTTVTIAANDEEGGDITVGGADHTWGTTTKVGVHTTKTLVVSAKTGYYFSEWTRSADPDFHLSGYGESNTTVTLTGDGAGETSGQTLTANFQPLDKIYFRNENPTTGGKLWNDGVDGNVYVFFDAYWDKDNKGAGGNGKAHATMTQITGTYIYWAYVPRDVTTAGYTKVAFSSRGWITDDNFYGGGFGAYRGDYNRALNMYVPARKESANLNSGVSYNNNGYWMKYDTKARQGAGYYLKKYDGRNSYSLDKQFIANTDNATSIQVTIRIDNTDPSNTKYMITSAGGLNYLAETTPSASSYSDINLNEDNRSLSDNDVYFQLSASSEGDYTFIIDQTRDTMRLTVDYPVSVGDYRLKNSYNDGIAKNTYSDVIKSSSASTPRTLSMYLNTDGSGTLVLQKCTAITAGVPQWNEGDATNLGGVLTTVGSNPGVYQFDLSVDTENDQVAEAPTATKYTGPYYIKTDGTTGGWVNYKQNYMSENTINYDTENPDKSFNYYYCKYYSSAGTNLKCVIANDYCNALTDTLKGDAVIGEGSQTTPSAANVRFSYNNYTNEIKRAYLGSSTNSNFLCVKGNTTASTPHIYDKDEASPGDATAAASIKFEDKQNWVYEIIVKADANARAKLTAVFNGNTQYFWGHAGESGHEWDNVNTVQLFGGSSGTYGLTLVYDFKTNKLINAWTPIGDAVNADLELNSDVLLLREHQEAPKTITFGKKDGTNYASLTEVKTAYCVLRFNRWKLSNRARPDDLNSEHCKTPALIEDYHPALAVDQDDAAGKWLPIHERELYFISFPYDVKMSDIISFGTYYDTWGIMYYDGKGRAKNGYWIDSEPNWKYFTPEEYATKTLNAYEGYLIGIDLATMRYDNTSFWTHNSSEADIYFPSNTAVSSITRKEVTVEIDTVGYQCTINRPYGSDGDRRIKDSHWHCIGVPAYANITHDINNGEAADETWENKELLYLYEWDTSTNDHHIKEASTFDFQAMYAYLVQYAGKTLTWAAAATGPSSIVAKRMKTEELRDRQFDLQLMQGNKKADHTYIHLSDDEEVTTGFEFNYDVSKMMLSGANIYTLIGKEQAAANSLPLNLEQTTVVPVGVKIAATGDYTFAIPEGTEGIGVVLVDNETGTRTNLSLTDYEVNLSKGTYDERFVLEISPIMYTPTGLDNIGAGVQDGIRKVMVDGILYIVRDGKIFDAQGKRVK